MQFYLKYNPVCNLFSLCGHDFIQAAVYGLGVCAEFGGSVFKALVGGKLLSAFSPSLCVT